MRQTTYQSWPDLNQSFNNFKKQFFMDNLINRKEAYQTFDECHNMGVDRCINFIKSQRDIYYAINPKGNEVNVLKSLIIQLEYFKKPTLSEQLTKSNNPDDLKDVL